MSTKSKVICLLLVLIFAFASLAAVTYTGVEMAAHSNQDSFTAYQVDGDLGGPASIIAGHCDSSPICSGGGG